MRGSILIHSILAWIAFAAPIYDAAAADGSLTASNQPPEAQSGAQLLPREPETQAYREEALRQLLEEANQIARELQLPEQLPLTQGDLVGAFIGPPDLARELQAVGTVTTRNYVYCVSRGNKFSFLMSPHAEEDFQRLLADYSWPISQMDTNAAYQMATQWLGAISVDVAALNRDHVVQITASGIRRSGLSKKFTPVYRVNWAKRPNGTGSVASVRLFTPTRKLMQLRVESPQYVLRTPLVITNRVTDFPEPKGRGISPPEERESTQSPPRPPSP